MEDNGGRCLLIELVNKASVFSAKNNLETLFTRILLFNVIAEVLID